MKMLRKCLLLLIAVLLVSGLLAIPSLATEEHVQTYSWTYENPQYADIVDSVPAQASYGAAMVDDIEYATSVEDVAAQLRAGMKARQNPVLVYVKDVEMSQAFLEASFNLAVAHTGEPDEGDYILEHFAGLDASASGNSHGWTIAYEMTYHTTAQQEAEVDAAVDALLEELDLYDATDYEKVCGIYDWMCENITYDYDGLEDKADTLEYSAYDAIVNKSAVCQGYANLFYRLMLELDVDTRIIVGEADGGAGIGGHAWNIVKLAGKYYYLDSTWDTSRAQAAVPYDYFLKGSISFNTDHFPDGEYTTAAFTAEYPIDAEDYTHIVDSGTCGDDLTWILSKDGMLEISGTGDMYDYDLVNMSPWTNWCSDIKTICVNNGITKIGSYAFYNCHNLISIVMPNSITAIGESAFDHCSSLTAVEIPKGVTEIKSGTFRMCTRLRNVFIPEGVSCIGDVAFDSCSALTSVEIPTTVWRIGSGAFGGCSSLTAISIPNTVTTIDEYAFSSSNLASVVIPNSIDTVADSLFRGCENLTSVVLPETITSIGDSAFRFCNNLASITIPKNVASIGEYAFNQCPAIITFEGNAPTISETAFLFTETTAYYPAGNKTWTSEMKQNYGGIITWEESGSSSHTHSFGAWYIHKQPACNAYGEVRRECENCEEHESIQLQMTDHAYKATVTAPVVGQQGYTTYTCTACGDSYVADYTDAIAAAAQIGTTQYATVADALAAAKPGETVTLITDVHEENSNLTIDEDVTLDLGAYNLYAKSLNGLADSYLRMTRYTNGDYGRLYVAKNRLALSEQGEVNGVYDVMPFWVPATETEAGYYVMTNIDLYDNGENALYKLNITEATEETAEKMSFVFQHHFGSTANSTYFVDGLSDNALELIVRVTWTDTYGNMAKQDFVYSDEFVNFVATTQGGYYTFQLTGYGAMNIDLDTLTLTPMVLSDSGMVFTGTEWEAKDITAE